MASQTLAGTTTGQLARVNLLPPEIAEKNAVRRSQLAMVVTGVAAVAVVGVWYTSASGSVGSAKSAKATAAADQTRLNSELNSYQSVSATYAQVGQAKTLLSSAMEREILWSGYLNDLTLTIPDNVWLTNLTATETVDSVAATSTTTAGQVLDPGFGTVSIAGVALSHDDVATWLQSLAKEKGYANAYFSDAHEEWMDQVHKVVKFTSSTTLTKAALSGRFTKTEAAR